MPKPGDSRFKILVISSALFARDGYHGTSIREIGKKCKLKQPSIYHYFHDKEHLYHEALKGTRHLFLRVLHDAITKRYDLSTELYSYFQVFDVWRITFKGTIFPSEISIMTHFLTAAPEKFRKETAFFLQRGLRRLVKSSFRRHGQEHEQKERLFLTGFYGFFFQYVHLHEMPFPSEDLLAFISGITETKASLQHLEASYQEVTRKIQRIKKYLLDWL
ncbi:MAG: TetR/AcrR family transcriptional regulator [Leptospiraceae bacterium]|nr:TetR/AcrR family transcriptional regulator [Leptospiraceae bacterium]MDW8306021.1 TetR/AcrR family transcriptional regulator [Leptospiraceae bacterium]